MLNISLVINRGAFFPGIAAVVIIASIFCKCVDRNFRCFICSSSPCSLAYPDSVSASLLLSGCIKLAPKLSICSPAANLTSNAKTIAPNLFAVAIACSPATPAPRIRIFGEGLFLQQSSSLENKSPIHLQLIKLICNQLSKLEKIKHPFFGL